MTFDLISDKIEKNFLRGRDFNLFVIGYNKDFYV